MSNNASFFKGDKRNYVVAIFAKLLHEFGFSCRRERFNMKFANGKMVARIFKRNVHGYI